jgi:hypothetical protein
MDDDKETGPSVLVSITEYDTCVLLVISYYSIRSISPTI